MSYLIKRASGTVDISAGWDSSDWKNAVPLLLDIELHPPKNGPHHPKTEVKMQYDSEFIYGLFKVDDRYVRALCTENQQQVCRDSCVEFFVRPSGCERYFNFEMNCSGIILLYDIKNCRTGDYIKVPEDELAQIKLFHTLPSFIDEEITEPVTWRLGFRIPIDFFVRRAGVAKELHGQKWVANFTKCADATSHPHWLTWRKLSKFDFHCPDDFGAIEFE